MNLSDGRSMPLIGFGTYHIRGVRCLELVKQAVLAGYRTFDTSSNYRNEADVGEALRECIAEGLVTRGDLFVTTKIGPKSMGYTRACASIANSQEALDLQYIDLVLIHWPGVAGVSHSDAAANRLARAGSWRALVEAQTKGVVRSIGVSNFTVAHLRQLASPLCIFSSGCDRDMSLQRCISHTAATRLEANEKCASEFNSDVGNATDVVECAGECMCGSYWKARPVVNQVEMHPMYPQQHLRQMSAVVPIPRVTTTDSSIRVLGSEQAPDEDKDPDTNDMHWTTYSQPKKCGAGHSGAHTPEDTHTNSTSTGECDSDMDSHTLGTVDSVATGYRLHVQAYSALGSKQGASLRTHPVIRDVSQSINRTPAQVLLRWCVQKGCGVLCQSTDADRMRENLDVFGWALDDVHVTRIDDIATGNEEGVKFCWDPGAIA